MQQLADRRAPKQYGIVPALGCLPSGSLKLALQVKVVLQCLQRLQVLPEITPQTSKTAALLRLPSPLKLRKPAIQAACIYVHAWSSSAGCLCRKKTEDSYGG